MVLELPLKNIGQKISTLLTQDLSSKWETMMPKKLSPEGEVVAAYGAATVAAFQVLINCLEESDALLPGQFPDALSVYMEMIKSRTGGVSDMTLAVLHDIRTATQN